MVEDTVGNRQSTLKEQAMSLGWTAATCCSEAVSVNRSTNSEATAVFLEASTIPAVKDRRRWSLLDNASASVTQGALNVLNGGVPHKGPKAAYCGAPTDQVN